MGDLVQCDCYHSNTCHFCGDGLPVGEVDDNNPWCDYVVTENDTGKRWHVLAHAEEAEGGTFPHITVERA